MSEYYMTKNELYHHGIIGQKWGVRRFQNEDGSLTNAGKERYGQVAKNVAKGAAGLFKAVNRASKQTTDRMKDGLRKTKQPEGTIGSQMEKSSKRQEKMAGPGEIKLLGKEKITAKLKDPKVQKAIKIGAAVAGTALVAYGAYKVSKGISANKKYQKALETGRDYYERLVYTNIGNSANKAKLSTKFMNTANTRFISADNAVKTGDLSRAKALVKNGQSNLKIARSYENEAERLYNQAKTANKKFGQYNRKYLSGK